MPRMAFHASISLPHSAGGICASAMRPSIPKACGSRPGLADEAVEAIDGGLRRRAGAEVRHPAVGQARHALLHDLALAAHPDRDRAAARAAD